MLIAKVTFVGDLKEIATNNPQYTQPLQVRPIEVKWFAPRSTPQGVIAGIERGGFELRGQQAADCRLGVGDIICFDYDFSSSRFVDHDQRESCTGRLIITRYAFVGSWDSLN